MDIDLTLFSGASGRTFKSCRSESTSISMFMSCRCLNKSLYNFKKIVTATFFRGLCIIGSNPIVVVFTMSSSGKTKV